MLRRNVEPFEDFWHVIGGHIENGETPEQALKREFKEETNLDITVGKLIGSRVETTADRTKKIAIFEVTGAQGKIKLNHEHKAYKWFSRIPPNAVYDYNWYILQKKR
jgi:8-oxo-dGTP diphosphatase